MNSSVHATNKTQSILILFKYLNIAFTESNSEVLKNMQKFGVELKIKLKR